VILIPRPPLLATSLIGVEPIVTASFEEASVSPGKHGGWILAIAASRKPTTSWVLYLTRRRQGGPGFPALLAIPREQDERSSETWFDNYSTPREVSWKCVELDAAGTAVWQASTETVVVLEGFPFGSRGSPRPYRPEARPMPSASGSRRSTGTRLESSHRLVNKKASSNDRRSLPASSASLATSGLSASNLSAFTCSGKWTGLTLEHGASSCRLPN